MEQFEYVQKVFCNARLVHFCTRRLGTNIRAALASALSTRYRVSNHIRNANPETELSSSMKVSAARTRCKAIESHDFTRVYSPILSMHSICMVSCSNSCTAVQAVRLQEMCERRRDAKIWTAPDVDKDI